MKTKPLFVCTVLTAACLSMASLPLAAAESGKGMDENFAMKAADGGMTEVELGKIAEKNGEKQMVKDFGAKMVSDHSKANDKLKAIAGKKGMTLPAKLSAKHQATVDKLSKLKGAEFDSAYMAEMLKDHETDVEEFSKAEKEVKDPDLKQFAAETLPVVKSHLQMLKSDMKK